METGDTVVAPAPCPTTGKLPSKMTLHAEPLDLGELNKFDEDNLFTTVNGSIKQLNLNDHDNSETEVDLDDIQPGESFSARGSPATSVVDGVVPTKPPISIFNRPVTPPTRPSEPIGLPGSEKSHPEKSPDRTKDDTPARYSDVENTPPLEIADLEEDDIPKFESLESDGEWMLPTKPPEFPTFPTTVSVETPDGQTQELGFSQEPKKKKKKKKKSKGV